MKIEEKTKQILSENIPLWNQGDVRGRDAITQEVERANWFYMFAEIEVTKVHESIEGSKKSVHTPLMHWEPIELASEVKTVFLEQFTKVEFEIPLHVYQHVRILTYRQLYNKVNAVIKSEPTDSRVPISSFASSDDIFEPTTIDNHVDELGLLANILLEMSKLHRDKVLCYILKHSEGLSTQDIAKITALELRTVQRYINIIGAKVKLELEKNTNKGG